MTGPDEPSARSHAARGMGQLLLYGSLGLVVAAAAILALGADDARLLRLGVLAALWAVLLGAFAAVTMRRQVTSGADRTEDLRTIYRLELEREIVARRAHELTVERELRREAKEDSRDELEAVRAELRSLHENLQRLFGGELLVERVAVRAESTRVRSLPEETPNLSPSRLRAQESRALERAQRSVPPPDQPAAGSAAPPPAQQWDADRSEPTGSQPLPRRDPDVRTYPTRRPRPEAPRPAGYAEDPLFGGAPQRSSPSWTRSWPSAPGPRDPWAPADPQPPSRPPSAPSQQSDPPTVPMVAVGRRHGGEGPEVPTGAHRGGRSVDDLLAAYGADSGARRRRRREDG